MLTIEEISRMISRLREPNLQMKFVKAFQILAEIRRELKAHQRILDLTQDYLNAFLEELTEKVTIERLKSMKEDFSLAKVDRLVKTADDRIRIVSGN
ncbi:MAG: hypothetical protein ACFFBS_04810 [Promethearchaeota archaeon]